MGHRSPKAPTMPPSIQRCGALYTSRWLMDDGVVVEPLVGNRIQRSLSAMDAAMVSVWGPGAINLDKLAEEGTPAKSQLLWGLHLDFEEQVVVLPEPKRIKVKYLLREPQLQRGLPTSSYQAAPRTGRDSAVLGRLRSGDCTLSTSLLQAPAAGSRRS